MNILHVTDFHYSEEKTLQTKVVKSIINAIIEKNLKIDIVFFTGDLVQRGNKIENFRAAQIELFDEFIKGLNIEKENIIFCPGNHDINRDLIHGATRSFFDLNITNDNELNSFYRKKTDSVYIDSLKPSINFKLFLSEYHSEDKNNIHKDLYSIHRRVICNSNVEIVSLNSAWLSAIDKEKSGKEDKGNLLLPSVLFDEIKKNLSNNGKKVLLIHHPLYFLKEFNFYGIEKHIHNGFDLLFSGHVHKISSVSRYSGSNGIFEHVAKASLSSKENLGCSIIEIDDEGDNVIKIKELTYIEDDDHCYIGEEINHTIPCGKEKAEIIAFRKKIFEKVSVEKDNANDLLLVNDAIENEDFLSLYNHPVIKKESEGTLESKTSELISLDDLISCKSNYLILGKDKCGKTTLLKRIQIECLVNYSRIGKIPFYFDAREFELKLDAKFQIERLIKNYFVISSAKVQQILRSKNFLFLVDNYNPQSSIVESLNKFFNTYTDISFLICTEYNLSRTVDVFQFGKSLFEKLYFHDLRRQEIIKYTNNRLSSNQRKEEIQTKIIQLCKQIELPLNYWTISLLLLIHNKSTDSYSKNLFSILDICIDEIFDKKQLTITHTRLSFEQLKRLCAELAKNLLINHSKTIYSAPYQDILNQICKTISENDRISANCKDVMDFLISCGIIKRKIESDNYVFRLNGFFEYFLALQMTKDNVFKNDILDDDVKFLAFKNQLEIYSGFKRDDFEFLLSVFNKSEKKLSQIFVNYNENKDEELLNKIQEPVHVEKFCKELSISKSLSSIEIAAIGDLTDELKIDSDVHEIKIMNPNEINSELVERYISITARVFRNLDEITGNKETIVNIFNVLIDWYCNLGFYFIDEFTEITKQEVKKDGFVDFQNFPELELLKFISNFSPLISQAWLFDGVGHYNLERLIKEEIEKIDPQTGQYKLYLLFFLLLDIDLNSNRKYIEIAMENIKIPILKYAIFLKLNYYLAFKGTGKGIQHELSKQIQKAKLNLDSNTNLGDIQKQIQIKNRLRNKDKRTL